MQLGNWQTGKGLPYEDEVVEFLDWPTQTAVQDGADP